MYRRVTSTARRAGRLGMYVASGLVLGAAYAALNTLFDWWDRHGIVVDRLATFHGVVDRVIPVLVGALLGLAVHYVRIRSELARAEARHAEELRLRLQKVERDQAAWVIAAATLHEVKNPLHALGLILEEVDSLDDADKATRDRLLGRARAQMDRILVPLGGLRALAGSQRPSMAELPLDTLVREVALELEPVAAESRVRLRVDAERAVFAQADPAYVRIILENLVGNSLDVLRARGGPGKLALSVRREREHAIVQVEDDGPGIAPGVRAALFEPLTTNKANGLGLGLSIAQALARAMRGELVCQDGAELATTFLLRLPAEAR